MATVASEYWIVLAVCLLLGFVVGWWAWSRRGRRIEIEPASNAPGPTLKRTVSPQNDSGFPAGASPVPVGNGPGDNLLRMKGVGPKLASTLHALGITRYEQIAAWSDEDVARVDAQLGQFQGRIARDRWTEQAKLLAADNRDGFEQAFGRIDGAAR